MHLNFSVMLKVFWKESFQYSSFELNSCALWQTTADVAVREMLREIAAKTLMTRGDCKLSASDFMDDGSCIQLTISIDPKQVSTMKFNFICIVIHARPP